MRRLLVIALLVLSFSSCVPVHARSRVVLCYGDSLTSRFATPPGPATYPAVLHTLRPELAVVNAGLPGDTTTNFPRFRAALAAHEPTDVVLLPGTNDVSQPDADPAPTARNLWRMARLARAARATVLILTPVPARCLLCKTRQTHTRAVAHYLNARGLRRRRAIIVADLRDEWTTRDFAELMAADGVQLSPVGHRLVATVVAAHLP